METIKLSSKLRESRREYLIQTANDIPLNAVATTVFVDGVRTDETSWLYPSDIEEEQLLSLIKKAHGEKKQELEGLLQAFHRIQEGGDVSLMLKLANALATRKLFSEASDLLTTAVRIDPDFHQGYNLLGIVLLAQGRVDEAIGAATEAVRYCSGYADYRNNLAEAYLARGAAAQAAAELEEAIRINLYYADAYFNLALSRLLEASRCGDRELTEQLTIQTRELLDKGVLIQPEYKNHRHFADGLTAMEARDFNRAITLFRSVKESIKERRRVEQAVLNKALLFDPESLSEDSIASHIVSLKSQLQKHPHYLDLQVELGRAYLEQARLIWTKGIGAYEKVAESQPDMKGVAEAVEMANSIRTSIASTLTVLDGKK